ncbi:MAG TPA: hypothetical protein VK085_13795 [Pseudogracilibacillus sp.]|nr:hypothetical protein [Pseudogracilibacillus sp.]
MKRSEKSVNRKRSSYRKRYHGGGIVNSVINKLPVELHIPGYNYCGPGTKLEKRLARGDKGINKLDEACKEHDISYNKFKDIENRHKADNILYEKAKQRLRSSDSSLGEKAAALGVAGVMKAKVKLGMGCKTLSRKRKRAHKKRGRGLKFRKTTKRCISKKRKIGKGLKRKGCKRGKGLTFKRCVNTNKKTGKALKFGDLVKKARSALRKAKFMNTQDAVKYAMAAVKKHKGKQKVKPDRVMKIPIKKGGFIGILTGILSALGALGALGGGAATVVRTINEAKAAKEQLKEHQRHNQTMEAIALGKKGSGLFLKPYKTGLGLFLGPSKFPKNFR